MALALAVAAAIAWSVPPLRTRERPILDVLTGAALVVLPAVAGFLVAGLEVADAALDRVAGLRGVVRGVVLAARHRGIPGRPSRGRRLHRDRARVTGHRGRGARRLRRRGRAGGQLRVAPAPWPRSALDLYLLLPAMVLLARRGDPLAEAAAGRRAWAGFIGLNDLVGVWLVLLWIRFNAVRGVDAWEIATIVGRSRGRLCAVQRPRRSGWRRAGVGHGRTRRTTSPRSRSSSRLATRRHACPTVSRPSPNRPMPTRRSSSSTTARPTARRSSPRNGWRTPGR